MKKNLFIGLVFFTAILLSCQNNTIAVEDSEKNFKDCFNLIENKLSEYGFNYDPVNDHRDFSSISTTSKVYSQSVSYVLTEHSSLDVDLQNEKGVEFRKLELWLCFEDIPKGDVIKFFCETANSITNAQIDKETVEQFIEPILSGETNYKFQILNHKANLSATLVQKIDCSWVKITCS